MAHLRKSNLKDGYITYTRSKTRQRLSLTSFLFFACDSDSKNTAHGKRQDELRLYHNDESRIAYHLKKLGTKMGIQGKLPLYVTRHSWATATRDKNISISIISEALGHHSEVTTEIYLRSIQSSEVDNANAKILALI